MPIAQSTPVITQTISKPIINNPPDSISRLDIGGVPVDVYTFFDTPLNSDEKVVNKLKVITNWAKSEVGIDGTDGDMLLKIRDLRNHLGAPDSMQKQYDKLFNYCKMTMYIKEVEKKRDALSRRY